MEGGVGSTSTTLEANVEGEKPKMTFATARRDVIVWFKSFVEDRSLLVFQIFYFFYFAAFGSLFPLISIYFKQLGLSALQCGALSGIRSLLECLVTPFWSALAEKWKKGKAMVLFSLVCSMSFTLGIGFVRPAPEGCLVYFSQHGQNQPLNMSDSNVMLSIVKPYRLMRYADVKSIDMTRDLAMNIRNKVGQSPVYLNTTRILQPQETHGGTGSAAYHDTTHYPPGSLVMPLYSTIVYSQTKINQIFIILVFLVLFGELLSCPALPLVDALMSQTIRVEQTNFYGRQRMSGSVAWGLAMFFIGIALDNASSFPDYPCLQPGAHEKNYIVCFATYSVFLACALFAATQLRFIYEGDNESMYFKMVKDKMARALLGRATKNRGKLVNEEDPSADDDEAWRREVQASRATTQFNGRSNEEILEKQLGIKLEGHTAKPPVSTAVFIENPQENYISTAHLKITQWSKAMKQFGKPSLLAFLFVTWFMGIGVGQVFTFLFWHLQELNGSPTLFGVATVFNHVSEICMYYFSKTLIDKVGHLNVLYMGLLINVARFLYVSWISNPWWILPFEFVQGLTHAGVWIACCSYITQAFAPELRSVTHGFLQGVHYGLGRGLGAIIGGLIISSYGSASMFCAYGAASAVVLLCFLTLNYFLPIPNLPNADDTTATGNVAAAGGKDEKAVNAYGVLPGDIQTGRTAGMQFGRDAFQPSTVTHDYYIQQQNLQPSQ